MVEVAFFAGAIGALGGAIAVIGLRNPFYSVLALVVHLVSLAGLFLLLYAEFLAAAQIVVYAGAVMVLYVFVAAYVGNTEEPLWEPIPGQRIIAPLLGLALFIELSIAVLGTALKTLDTEGPTIPDSFGSPEQIGNLLLEDFLIPFEAASLLLLLAAVGAVVLAAKRPPPTTPANPQPDEAPPKPVADEGPAGAGPADTQAAGPETLTPAGGGPGRLPSAGPAPAGPPPSSRTPREGAA
jgi:NADH-quinone oxidoreductase subunit J